MKIMTKFQREGPAVVTERQKVEYDQFGPWTYPVMGAEEMPPRFDPWYEELKGSTLILKLPFDMDRRRAKAGDDLYESILAVGSRGIVHLSLSKGKILRRDISFGEIASIRRALELLSGRLRLDLAGGLAFSVFFNAVSSPFIDDFVDAVRGACATGGEGRLFSPAELTSGPPDEDALFQNLFRELRKRKPALALLLYQAPCCLESRKEGGRRGIAGLAARLQRWRLDGCLLAAAPSELIVLIRGSGTPRKSKNMGYRFETLYIPAQSFRGAAAEARTLANGARIHVLRLSSVGHDYELLVEREPSEVLASL